MLITLCSYDELCTNYSIIVLKIIHITDLKLFVVGQNIANSIHYVSSQSSVIMGRYYPVSENMTPNKEFNNMHSTTKVVSSLRTITNGQSSLTEDLYGDFITPHLLRLITIDTDCTKLNIY